MTFDELTEPLTVDECKAAIYATLAAAGTDVTVWKPGAVTRAIITGVAIVLAAFSRLQVAIAKSGFIDLATGDWLTLVALYVYGVTRDTGSFATGIIDVDNSSGSTYSGDADDLVFLNSTTGKTYRNTGVFSIVGGANNYEIAVRADELGTGSTASAGQINALVTTLLGVTVTNDVAIVGTDAESDASLRARCREKLGSLSPNGAKDAYAYFAKTTKRADGSSIGVTRVRAVGDGLGTVSVYVATASGGVTGTAGDPATDLGAINQAIQLNVVPLGVTATVATAVVKEIDVNYDIWLKDTVGVTEAEAETKINAALTAYFASVPIGGEVISPATGKVYKSAIEAVIGRVFPDHTVRIDVDVPLADVSIATNEAPVGDDYGVNVVFVPAVGT